MMFPGGQVNACIIEVNATLCCGLKEWLFLIYEESFMDQVAM